MQNIELNFQIKRGVADVSGQEIEILEVVHECLALCRQEEYERAVKALLPILRFEWIWSNCDGDPSDIFESLDDISLDLNSDNSIVRVGQLLGNLVVTATVTFPVRIKDGLSLDEVTDWLSENSAYSCGYVGAGWIYIESDGDNVWVSP